MGHLNGILARVGGNLNNNFQKSQMPGWLPGGAMLKLRFDRYIILDEMCRLYGNFASYVRRVLFFHTKKEFNVQTPPRSLGPTKRECY